MKNNFSIISAALLLLLLVSCGHSGPKITHIMVKSDAKGILIDTNNKKELKILENIFYDKEEKPDSGPDFRYLIDISTKSGTTRWQYSQKGFIRKYDEIGSIIYQLTEPAQFNRTAHINESKQ